MKIGNLVAIKYRKTYTTRRMDGKEDLTHIVSSIIEVIEDVIQSEKDGKYFVFKDIRINESDIIGSKVLVK